MDRGSTCRVGEVAALLEALNEASASVKVVNGAIEFIVVTDLASAPVVNTNYVVLETIYADGDKIKFAGDDTLYENKMAPVTTPGVGYVAPAAGDIVVYTLTDGKVTSMEVKVDISAATANKVKSVSGAVINCENAVTGVIGSKAVVFVYEGVKTSASNNSTVTKYAAAGTTADIVKDAYVYGWDGTDADTAWDIIIVVK